MLTRFFTIIVALSYCATTFAQDALLETEAARFAKEAEFLHSQGRYEAALEAAETAAALDPGNTELRQMLIKALTHHSSHLSTTDELETARLAFHLAERAVELGVSLGVQDSFQGYGKYCPAGFLYPLHKIAVEQYPELKPDSNRINRRFLDHWLEHRFRPMISRIHSKASCEETLRKLLFEANNFYFLQGMYPITDFANTFEETMGAMLRLTEEWNVEPATPYYLIHYIHAVDHCRCFVEMVASHRDVSLLQIDRTIALLENDSRPFFRFFGWVAKNRPTPYSQTDYTEEGVPQRYQVYFTKLLELLNEQPPGMSFWDGDIYYNELNRSVTRSQQSRFEYYPLPYYERILETANQRHESALYTVRSTLSCLEEFHRNPVQFQSYNQNIQLARIVEIEQRFKQLIPEQIERMEIAGHQIVDQQTVGSLKGAAIWVGMMLPKPEMSRSKPWIAETVYQLIQEVDLRTYDVVLRGETLYLFKTTHGGSSPPLQRRVDQLDIRTGNIKSSKELPCRAQGGLGSVLYNSNVVFVDDRNAYYGAVNTGIQVFPLDGSEPWELTEKDGLPSNNVQALGSIGGKLYAGLGRDLGDFDGPPSWLVAVDLRTKKIETLASSSGREGKVPFYNLSPAPRFSFFLEDAKHNRLLLFVFGSPAKHDIGGLWAIDGITGDFEQLKQLQCSARYGQLLADGDHVQVTWPFESYLIDLNDTNRNTPTKLLWTSGHGEGPLFQGIMFYGPFYNGYFWGSGETYGNNRRSFDWARIPLGSEPVDGHEVLQELQYPGLDQRQTQMKFNWPQCRSILPMPDGKRLVVCGENEIFILHFE